MFYNGHTHIFTINLGEELFWPLARGNAHRFLTSRLPGSPPPMASMEQTVEGEHEQPLPAVGSISF